MAKSYDSFLKETFPEATYIAAGLDAGKWETEHYLFHLKASFYTVKSTGKTSFVSGNTWRETIMQLKQFTITAKEKDLNLIGKE